MYQSALARMNKRISRVFLTDTCELQRRNDSGVWVTSGIVACNVQSDIVQASVEDETVARPDERVQVSLYVEPQVDIAVGDRAIWGGRIWNVGSTTRERSARGMTRAALTDWQSAVPEVSVAFWRYRNGSKVTLGPFMVHLFTDDRSGFLSQATTASETGTATGGIGTGSFTGGPELAALMVGDWFNIEGNPGRVTDVITVDPERVRVPYTLDSQRV